MEGFAEAIVKKEKDIYQDWLNEILSQGFIRQDLISEDEIKSLAKNFLKQLVDGLKEDGDYEFRSVSWEKMKSFLANISKNWARLGFTSSETSIFIFSLANPVFRCLKKELKDAQELYKEAEKFVTLTNRFGIYTFECYLKGKEEVIRRQQEEMLELSTPIIKLWEGILALPLIGTLDSARTQIVMENLLQKIVETSSSIAIIDITGVPTVDTLVAQHIMKTVTSARLMGAECIISGIRPQIAQTMVHLGVSFSDIITKATLADALRYSLGLLKFSIKKIE